MRADTTGTVHFCFQLQIYAIYFPALLNHLPNIMLFVKTSLERLQFLFVINRSFDFSPIDLSKLPMR